MHSFDFPTFRTQETYDPASVDLTVVPYFVDEKKNITFKTNFLPDLTGDAALHIALPSSGFLFLMHQARPHLLVALPEGKTDKWSKLVAAAVGKIPSKTKTAALLFDEILDTPWQHMFTTCWFDTKKPWSAKSKAEENYLQTDLVWVTQMTDLSDTLLRARAQALTKAFAQMLVNMPSNILTPTTFAHYVERFIAKENLSDRLHCTVYDQAYMEQEKMGALLGVAKGSSEPPTLVHLEYHGNTDRSAPPTSFVGKGITFDTGGINIKPSAGLNHMKSDMAGAASAVAAALYAAMLRLPLNVSAIAVCAENMPSAHALKPADVIYAQDGTSIEVIDTDAEGRLVLADALLFAQRFNPAAIIDMATLTGACVVALGDVHTGLFSNNDALKEDLLAAAKKSSDAAWHMPIAPEHEEFLKSDVADISNLCIGKGAGAQNGAVFLKHFIKNDTPWAHLDIAGTSYSKSSGATGRPVGLLCAYLDALAGV